MLSNIDYTCYTRQFLCTPAIRGFGRSDCHGYAFGTCRLFYWRRDKDFFENREDGINLLDSLGKRI